MECITSVRVLTKTEIQNVCESCARVCVSVHFNSGVCRCVTPSHPVTAALHPRLPPFRSHHQQADYSLATATLFTPYAATNYWALTPELSPWGNKGGVLVGAEVLVKGMSGGWMGGGVKFTPLVTLSQPYL